MYLLGYLSDNVVREGWRDIEPKTNQNGWKSRGAWFRKDRALKAAFKPEGVTFLGAFKVKSYILLNEGSGSEGQIS